MDFCNQSLLTFCPSTYCRGTTSLSTHCILPKSRTPHASILHFSNDPQTHLWPGRGTNQRAVACRVLPPCQSFRKLYFYISGFFSYLSMEHHILIPPGEYWHCSISQPIVFASFLISTWLLVSMTFDRFYSINKTA